MRFLKARYKTTLDVMCALKENRHVALWLVNRTSASVSFPQLQRKVQRSNCSAKMHRQFLFISTKVQVPKAKLSKTCVREKFCMTRPATASFNKKPRTKQTTTTKKTTLACSGWCTLVSWVSATERRSQHLKMRGRECSQAYKAHNDQVSGVSKVHS